MRARLTACVRVFGCVGRKGAGVKEGFQIATVRQTDGETDTQTITNVQKDRQTDR